MTVQISTALRNHIVDSIVNSASGINFDDGVLEIRTGSAPGPNAADSGTLLVSISLPADAFGDADAGSADKSGTWEDTDADASGTAEHFRLKQNGDSGGSSGGSDERIEGTVGGDGSGEDIELDSTSITAGQTVEITSFSVTQPE